MHKLLMAITFDGLDAKIEEYQIKIGLAETDEEVMDLSLKLAKLIAIKNERDRNKIKPEFVVKNHCRRYRHGWRFRIWKDEHYHIQVMECGGRKVFLNKI